MDFKKELVEAYERTKLSTILILLLVVIVDAFCFALLMEKGGLGPFLVLLLGLLCGLITNIASYLSSERGFGYRNKIPNIPQLRETLVARKEAFLVFIVLIVFILILQGLLAYLRYQQIQKNEVAYDKALIEYTETKGSDEFKARLQRDQDIYIRNKPRYDNGNSNRILDYFTLFLPIFTSVVSFVIGSINGKKFDVFEKELDLVNKGINDIINKYNEKIHKLEEQEKYKIQKLNEEKNKIFGNINKMSNTLLEDARKLVKLIQSAGDFVGLEKAILARDEGQTHYYDELMRKLDDNLKQKAPDLYVSHIEKLYSELIEMSSMIHSELSKLANNPDDLKSHTIKNQTESITELNELKSVDINFLVRKGS
jgi:hypothetical protein